MRTPTLAVAIATGIALAAVPAAAAAAPTIAPRDRAALERLDRVASLSFHDTTGKVRFAGTRAGDPIPRPAGLCGRARPGRGRARVLRDERTPLRHRRGDQRASRDQGGDTRQARGCASAAAAPRRPRNRRRPGRQHGRRPEHPVGQWRDASLPGSGGRAEDLGFARALGRRAGRRGRSGAPRSGPQRRGARALDLRLGAHRDARQLERVLVWRTEVTSKSRPDMRELVLVDARTGKVTLNFSQIAHGKTRQICDAGNAQARVPCNAPYTRQEGGGASAVADVNDAYDFSGLVYDFFFSRFARDSIDNAGLTLKQTVRYCQGSCPYENAFWNGQQMVYGPGYASADDVVGHEMVHGITERTSGLFYWFQSGAINESLSDVFGELFDQTSPLHSDDSAGVRWQMGEDLPIGAIRRHERSARLQQPGQDEQLPLRRRHRRLRGNRRLGRRALEQRRQQQGRVPDDRRRHVQRPDRVRLGITKVAAIYYEVDSNMLTSGSDYADLYNALLQACQNLVGTQRDHDVRLHRGAGRRAGGGDEPPAVQQPERLPLGARRRRSARWARSRRTPSTTTWRAAARTGASRRPSGPISGSSTRAATTRTAAGPRCTRRTRRAGRMSPPSCRRVTIPGGTTYLRFDQAR